MARGPTAAETVETVQKQRAKGDRNRLRQKEFLYLVQNGLHAKKLQTILGRKYNRKRQLRASIELKNDVNVYIAQGSVPQHPTGDPP